MSKLSRDETKRIADKASMFSSVNLKCDGYQITLREKLVQRKLRVILYVDGHLKGGWILDPELHPESKFYMPYVRHMKKSPRSKKKVRIEGHTRQVDFASVGQALRHLNKVCDSIEVIEEKDCD